MLQSRLTVLVVEDQRSASNLLRSTLEPEYDVIVSERGDEALQIARAHTPDVIILDLQLPGMSGIDVCRHLRNDPRTESTPLLMLTGLSEEADRIVGLEMGADDYVTKPFSPREIRARIRALLRRATRSRDASGVIVNGPIRIDPNRHEVSCAGQPVELTPTQFRILYFLASHAGTVQSREQISNAVHDGDAAAFERTIDAHIKSIRRRLGAGAELIETVRGFGYRLRDVRR
mgnify:CR=1 FL=1